jgi:hypothetical protein
MQRVVVGVLALLLSQCDEKPKATLAPAASALTQPKPAAAGARTFVVDAASSAVSFTMDAELEKISGRAPGALRGELALDASDIAKSSGLVQLDLDRLVIHQRKRDDGAGEFGPETQSEKQNADMRTWFEISSDTPPQVRETNRWAEFRLTQLSLPSARDVATSDVPERSLTAEAKGDFRLHGRVKPRSAKLEIRIRYADRVPREIHVRTTEPFAVPLEEHDVRPRSAFGKLADKTLDALGAKVSKVALISLDFTARLKP